MLRFIYNIIVVVVVVVLVVVTKQLFKNRIKRHKE